MYLHLKWELGELKAFDGFYVQPLGTHEYDYNVHLYGENLILFVIVHSVAALMLTLLIVVAIDISTINKHS